jgi:hypothetical protein
MISPGLTRSSPGSMPTGDRYEINNRDPSRLTQQAALVIRTLGTEFAHFFLLKQDGETATSAKIIDFSTALCSPSPGRAMRWL